MTMPAAAAAKRHPARRGFPERRANGPYVGLVLAGAVIDGRAQQDRDLNRVDSQEPESGRVTGARAPAVDHRASAKNREDDDEPARYSSSVRDPPGQEGCDEDRREIPSLGDHALASWLRYVTPGPRNDEKD